MATLLELHGQFKNSDLMDKVEAALVIKANGLLGGTPTTAEKAWASAVFDNPSNEAKKALMAVLASNSSSTVAVIEAASDTAIQTNVDSVAPFLVDAMAGV